VLTTLEERVSRLEGIIEQISERLANIERAIEQGQESLRAEMRSNFHWMMGAIFATWITLIGTVMGVLLTR